MEEEQVMEDASMTIVDIAKIAGVGVATVSRVMNNHPDVHESTRAKVTEVIEQYNYIPNGSARNLKLVESNCIGILIKGVDNTFFTKIIATLEARVVSKGYAVLLQHVAFTEDEIIEATSFVKEKRLAGLVFLGGNLLHTEEKINRINCPSVFVTTTLLKCRPDAFSSVYVSDAKEAFNIVSHLAALGHRKIAFMTTDKDVSNHSMATLRLDGYKEALAKYNIAFDESKILCANEFSMKAGYESMRDALHNAYDFTALFAISDVLAVGAGKAMTDAGLRIPDDISLAGFDGQEVALYYNPSITTVSQPVVDMANKAADQLFKLMLGGRHRQYEFEGQLVEGASCAPPAHV